MRVPLVLATTNVHKIRELRAMLKGFSDLDLLTLTDFPHYTLPEETGSSFEENAALKGVHAATHLNHWVLADDSGLVVPALDGAPGIFSARYAGKNATDFDNRKKLLEQMEHLVDEERNAYMECWLVLASPKGVEKVTHASCEGSIGMKEKGGSGCGYDLLFIKHGYGKTLSELGEAVKNRISHRRKALDKLTSFLESDLLSLSGEQIGKGER
jgi:XTP/dITP diphosphohydrolase